MFPLAIHASGRYLTQADGTPFFVHGDTAWSMAVQLTTAQIDEYFDDRQAKGVNAVILNLIEHEFSSQTPADENVSGERPFTSPGAFASPNEAYWVRIDYIVNAALARGIVLLAFPAYFGFNGGSQGWYSELLASSDGDLQTYGAFLANRYTQWNIIWPWGGDYDGDATGRAKQRNILTGIRSVRTTDLSTFHPSPNKHALEVVSTADYPNFVNWSYAYVKDGEYPFEQIASAYAASGPVPVIFAEGQYEGEHSTTAFTLRQQSYSSLMSGACGQFFGNNPVWYFLSGWETAMDATGSAQQVYVKALMTAYSWRLLEPATDNSFVSSSKGGTTSPVCPALASDGSFGMIYMPSSQNVTVVMSAMTPSSVRVRRYNVTDGTYATVSGSPFANTGSQVIASGGETVLVFDAEP